MYLSINYRPVSGSVIRSVAVPAVGKRSGRHVMLFINIIILPCGRRLIHVPASSGFVHGVPLGSPCWDSVFQSVNSAFNALSFGGSLFYLSCSRSDFYHRCHTDYRSGYRD